MEDSLKYPFSCYRKGVSLLSETSRRSSQQHQRKCEDYPAYHEINHLQKEKNRQDNANSQKQQARCFLVHSSFVSIVWQMATVYADRSVNDCG